MSFTRAKNPVQDSGFNLRNLSGTAGDLVGYVLFFTAVLVTFAVASGQLKPIVMSLLNQGTGGIISGDSGGAWEGW